MKIMSKGLEYIKKLKEEYTKDKWKIIEGMSYGISNEDKEQLLKEYSEFPKSLLEILNVIDGTYHRFYGEKCLSIYFFKVETENEKVPFYLLSAEQMLLKSENTLKLYGEEQIEEFVSEEITKNVDDVKWLHFADDSNNGGYSSLYIDFSPSEKGKQGQVIQYIHDPDKFLVIANSFDDLLDKLMKY